MFDQRRFPSQCPPVINLTHNKSFIHRYVICGYVFPTIFLCLLTEKEQHSLSLLPPICNISFSPFSFPFKPSLTLTALTLMLLLACSPFLVSSPVRRGAATLGTECSNKTAGEILHAFLFPCRAYRRELARQARFWTPSLPQHTKRTYEGPSSASHRTPCYFVCPIRR